MLFGGIRPTCISLEKLAFLFHDHLLAFKAPEPARPLVKARFEFKIFNVTGLVTIKAVPSFFLTGLFGLFAVQDTPPQHGSARKSLGSAMSNQPVVIDASVVNYQSLMDQLGSANSNLPLDAESDDVTQIENFVPGNSGFDAIHLISCGSPCQVAIAASTLSEAAVGGYSGQLGQIGASLSSGGDLLIYGCGVAQEVGGAPLVTDNALHTRLDVAALTNQTGGTRDWVL